MKPSHSPDHLPLLLCIALGALMCSRTVQAQLAVAFFDDYSVPDPRQSYLVSTDGQTLEGVVFVKAAWPGSLRNGSLEVKSCDTGDISSQSVLDECKTPFHTVGFTCPSDSLCSVKLQSLRLPFDNFCQQIGRAIVIDFFQSDQKRLEAARIKAVVGFGNVSFADCPFTRAPLPRAAIVKMMPTTMTSGPVQGIIVFQQLNAALCVSGYLMGLPLSSTLGMHLHTFGDIRDNVAASTTGMHFMFSGQQHGLVNNNKRHTGDLGNIVTNKNGISAFNILVPLDINIGPILTLLSQNGSAVGRSVILHANADDGVTQPTGNSGSRIAQGVVGSANNVNTSEIITLLNQGTPEGFYCACILCGPVGVAYAGFCSKSDCALPPPNCSPPPSPVVPETFSLQFNTYML